jgi:hypothetical protein
MTLFRGKSLKLYLDGTKTNQILFFCWLKRRKNDKKIWTQKPEKIHEKKTKKRLAYIMTRRGVLIIFGSWHTLFMSGVLTAGEQKKVIIQYSNRIYPRYLYIYIVYIYIYKYIIWKRITWKHLWRCFMSNWGVWSSHSSPRKRGFDPSCHRLGPPPIIQLE